MKTFILWKFTHREPECFRLLKIRAKDKEEALKILKTQYEEGLTSWSIRELDRTKQIEELEYL